MAKNLAKANGACNAKTVSEGQDFSTPWVIYNPNSTNFKVLYSVHGSLNGQNEFYGDEFDGCGGGGSGSGSGSGGDRYKVTATYYAEEQRSIAPCQILYSTDSIDSMKVDGVEAEVATSYTFSSVGEHTVEFTLTSDSIGNNTFSGCTKMTSFTIGSGITSVGVSALDGCISLTSVTIPDSVTSIGNNAFSGCTSLTTIDIPSGVTSIGNSAFHSCSSLTSIDIPSDVTTIGDSAFAHCSGLTSVTIPDSVTNIGQYAFSDCSSIDVTLNSTTPPTLGSYAFYYTSCTIYVPCDSVDDYKSASGWSDYSSYIEKNPSCGGGGSGSGSGNGNGGEKEGGE